MRKVQAGGEAVLVIRLADGWYGTASRCTHLMAPLDKGKLEGEEVVCPFHRARFDVRTGAVRRWANWPPGLAQAINLVRREKKLRTYPVVVEGDAVLVEVDASGASPA
jgi:3-phenylpropionate/trans-cinnamate dioxygenase ferredoxin subunit